MRIKGCMQYNRAGAKRDALREHILSVVGKDEQIHIFALDQSPNSGILFIGKSSVRWSGATDTLAVQGFSDFDGGWLSGRALP